MLMFSASFFKSLNQTWKRVSTVTLSTALLVGLSITPVWAGDPFREGDQAREIGDNTEAAFKAMFERGNYQDAQWYLEQAASQETEEPMVYALLASLAYQQQDLEDLKTYADQTMSAAKALASRDLLRSNLYIAIAYFLDGAYILSTEGTLKGAPVALNMLKDVFKHMDAAAQIDASDPELNLVRGYMDVFLALNLPFSDVQAAIEKLEEHGNPRHLAYRGLAIAYRDLQQHEKALLYVNKAIEDVPENPELLYIKAQLLNSIAKRNNNNPTTLTEAQKSFEAALAQPQQLPKRVVAQIFYEQCKNLNRIDNQTRACDPMRDTIRETNSPWGPIREQMPSL
ncbi:Sll0314/Alr1548 family TPR repeat-containing protein [Capilliphycus salinus ALCB114379]|uniref:Sll0314/Alr1548 family TPR repeat-containing protein n=1 Tax=Capilliphycus salinus TaxID=2768948 RepID=UPI0039A48043